MLRAIALASASSTGAIPETEKGQPNGVASLDAGGKIPTSEMPVGDVTYKGNWNAATNTPTLANGVGTAGDLHICDVAGTQNLGGGSVAYSVGDWLIYDGAVWDKVPGAGAAPANPTAQVGTAAINGAAPTFMRSDAAPPINQAIIPTWTGLHTFNGSTSGTTPSVILGGTDPELRFFPSNGSAGSRMWRQSVVATPGLSSFGISGSTDALGNLGYVLFAGHDGTKVISTQLGAGNQQIIIDNGTTPGITSNSGSGTWAHTGSMSVTGNFAVQGQLGSGANTTIPSPTNSGVVIGGAPTYAIANFYDQAFTVNNRTAQLIWINNSFRLRFSNDAGGAVVEPFIIAGGQATGITGIATDSGSGSWVHTGDFTATRTSGNSLTMAGTASGGTPSLTAAGVNPNVSMDIASKGAGGITFTSGAATRLTVNSTDLLAGTGYAPANALSLATKEYVDASLPAVATSATLINQAADTSNGSLYAVTADGTYRASCYVVLTRAATTSATVPGCNVSYTDFATNVAMTSQMVQSAVGNVVGTHLNGTAVFEAKTGTNIGFSTGGYASSGATTMQYRVRVVIERLS